MGAKTNSFSYKRNDWRRNMLEVLQFIFSDFWIWFGFTITTVISLATIRGESFIKIYNKRKNNE